MNPSLINWAAVIVAALSAFLVGGIWYSPVLFANAWIADNKLNPDDLKASSKLRSFGMRAFSRSLWPLTLPLFWPIAKLIWHGVQPPVSWPGYGHLAL